MDIWNGGLDAEEYVAAARGVCCAACEGWRRGALPEPWHSIIYRILYDLPGGNFTTIEKKLAAMPETGVREPLEHKPRRLTWSTRLEQLGVWPRWAVSSELVSAPCNCSLPVEEYLRDAAGYGMEALTADNTGGNPSATVHHPETMEVEALKSGEKEPAGPSSSAEPEAGALWWWWTEED
eukprot:3594394-Prymnesium_polylepis.1